MFDFSVTGCGGIYYLNETNVRDHHTLVSPGNLEGYSNNLRCEWFFYAPLFSSVGITFNILNLEDSYDCSLDYVQIWGRKYDIKPIRNDYFLDFGLLYT